MGVRRLHATFAGLAAAAVRAAGCAPVAAGAPAAPVRPPWATVNVCDSTAHPNAIGIRGAMPRAAGRGVRTFMRFGVQYETALGEWRALGTPSDWVRPRAGQAGRTFQLTAPPAGRPYVVRGVAAFEWRRGDRVLRHARRVTTAGHGPTMGADPLGLSAATCRVS
jgi:hypothetical protein